jgi:DNA-binding transcriptional regulator YbjK
MPKVGAREHVIEAAYKVAEYGLEYLEWQNIGAMAGLTGAACRYHFRSIEALRAAVIELAKQRRNPFILGQLKAMRPLPVGGLR